jgi:phosphoribosylformylglycinamidine synthase
MYDLIKKPSLLKEPRGIVFVGGFSYSDVFGAANGWYSVINNNDKLKHEFTNFYERENTFSLGICNGCQLMAYLGWIEYNNTMKRNISDKFESHFTTVKVPKNNNIFLSNMAGLQYGIWVAHGEGRFVENSDNVALNYIDPDGNPTERYPFNPNGSINGIAAIGSKNGRHLAMMPHPERCFLNWQVPYKPVTYDKIYSPWFKMFQNAYNWCTENST